MLLSPISIFLHTDSVYYDSFAPFASSLRARASLSALLSWLLTHATRIGDAAKNAFATNPENTVFDAKRLIGRKIDDPEIKKDMKHWPFKVIEKNGKPYIRVKHRGDDKEFVRPLY